MKILVIQQKMIGDVLLSSLICENLRKAYPQAQIDYLVNESTALVVQNNPAIDRLILFTPKQEKSFIELIRFGLKLRQEQYDLVIDAYSKLQSWILVGLNNAPRKISYKKPGRTFLYTDNVIKTSLPATNLGLAIEHRLSLLDPLKLSITKEVFPKITVTEKENAAAVDLLKQHAVNTQRKTIMISLLGSDPSKTYPLPYMAELINYLADNYDVNLLFNYFPKQLDQAKEIWNLCSESTRKKVYFDLLGSDLRGFIALMNHCDAIIGNDGGAINMAKALNKKSFIIFSPWIEKKVWATFEDGKNHTSVHLNDFKPELFQHKKTKELKHQFANYYLKFTPAMIKPKLVNFMDSFINEA